MKMYEKMGINPNTVEGVEKIFGLKCDDINDGHNGNEGKCKYPNSCTSCKRCKAERLFEEIPAKKVQRGTTYTDFKKAYRDFVNDVGKMESFVDWLSEEIEVTDD